MQEEVEAEVENQNFHHSKKCQSLPLKSVRAQERKRVKNDLFVCSVEVAINNKEIRAKIGLIQTEKHIVELKKIIVVDGYSYIKHYTNNNDSIFDEQIKEFEQYYKTNIKYLFYFFC